MVKGTVIRLKPIEYADPETKVQVINLTGDLGGSRHPYFTQNLFTRGGEAMVISSMVKGEWQLFLLRLYDNEAIQLTEDPGGTPPSKPCLDAVHNVIYYWVKGGVLKRIHIDDLSDEIIYKIPRNFNGSILSCSNDGNYIAFAYSEVFKDRFSEFQVRESFKLNMFLKPRSIIIRLNTARNESDVIWGEDEWITHVNINPIDPNVILFNHEGPWYLVQRMHIVKADTYEYWPLYVQRRLIEMVGHEFFTNDGRVIAQYGKRSRPGSGNWVYYDMFINIDGSDLRLFKYPGPKPGHIKANSTAKMAVGDRGYLTGDFKDGDKYIALIKYNEVELKVDMTLLCRHDSSWTNDAHPHPIFTPNDEYVVFTSDKGGKLNVYLCNVKDRVKELGWL
ncbi:oligogalacturonate lyase family protein [Caldivirga sp.]|uniref:oligogalacturonate lyase family protein n=1 Tax=Caldivirga sp. TaxID=2080243 RepID=UPI0025C37812|nr:oligogalacturonate lyase family protein [Caldivirga sp.]